MVEAAAKGRRVFFVRHGEAEASWGQSADPGLSPLGREQAVAAAEQLLVGFEDARHPHIVSSPLLRARQTAEPLAERLGLSVETEDRVREIPSPVPLAERQDWLRGFMRGRWSDQDRGLHAWRASILEVLDRLPDQAVVFTHFLVLNAIVGAQEQCDETLVFWPANASITQLQEHADGRWRVTLGEQMPSRVN